MGIEDIYEAQREFSLNVLIRSKVLKSCDYHEGTYLDCSGEIQDAYKYANTIYTKSSSDVPFSDRTEMTDMIKMTYDEYCADECYSCAKWRDD